MRRRARPTDHMTKLTLGLLDAEARSCAEATPSPAPLAVVVSGPGLIGKAIPLPVVHARSSVLETR